MITLPILGVLWFALFMLRPLQRLLDWPLISQGTLVLGILAAFSLIQRGLSEGWTRWLVGLGPGNSVSRVALMALDAFVKHDSPAHRGMVAPIRSI